MAEKKTRFKDIAVGQKFLFPDWTMANPHKNPHGPYVKLSSRTYQYASQKRINDELKRAQEFARIYKYKPPKKLPPIKVGSINAEVIRA